MLHRAGRRLSPRVRTALVATAALAAVLVAGGWGLSWSIDPTDIGLARRVLVYSVGRPVVDRSIEPGSAEERSVADWFNSHSKGWHTSFVTYVPGRQIEGDDFSLNFLNGFCVLNYQYHKRFGGVGHAQVVRNLRSGEPIPDVFQFPAPTDRR